MEGELGIIRKKYSPERYKTLSSAWEQSRVTWGWEVRQKPLVLSWEHRVELEQRWNVTRKKDTRAGERLGCLPHLRIET